MKEVTGILKMLGSGSTKHGTVGSSFVKYKTIEIGDDILQKIVTSQSLHDFVTRGLGEEVTLFLNEKMLIGVKLASGKVYFWKRSILMFLFSIFMSIFIVGNAVVIGITIGNIAVPILIALAIVFFMARPFIMQTLVYQPRLSALGGIGLRG